MSRKTKTTDRVQEILSWYRGIRDPGVIRNLERMLMTGRLAGTGYLNPYPVDQGIEHGPGLSFLPNPPAFDPLYHPKFALDAGCSAYAAPLGFIEEAVRVFGEKIPLILKLNNKEALASSKEHLPAVTSSVKRALELRCGAIGFTIYPASHENITMYERLQVLIEDAHSAGLLAVVWSYPRGKDLDKDEGHETAIDVCCYAAHLACQLGADVIKIKPPTDVIARGKKSEALYKAAGIETLAKRVALVIKSAFNGRRIVIFSGGAKKDSDDAVIAEIEQIAEGGGFGSIMGRNAFQREKAAAIKLINRVQDVYLKAAKS